MGDSLVAFGKERSYFAKNSDRDTAERQLICISEKPNEDFYNNPFEEKVEKYIENSFSTLEDIFSEFNNNYKAVVSKPVWTWGAEMGVNEYGVSIGNQAVFSKEEVSKKGLLGVDILRLALHNSKTAKEAVDFIIKLIENHGQGGDGGYKRSLKYDNSFLIRDFAKAYLLESAGKHWAVKEIKEYKKAVSNAYSIKDDYDRIDKKIKSVDNFKNEYENKLKTYFAKGNTRKNFINDFLEDNDFYLSSIMKLLRSHISKENKLKRGRKAICMHSAWAVKSETTSSMIVEYFADDFIIWMTASPNPCVSLYKPLIMSEESHGFIDKFKDKCSALRFSSDWRELSHRLIDDWSFFARTISVLRDKKEKEIKENMHKAFLDNKDKVKVCNESLELAEEFREDLYKLW
ncbi:MAG TPA: hypothetical protein VJ881_06900 [Halanaerobiales bacterium]|nr:hypothetical protein [Halanaerobiales bacterium]